jgi:hypothetical protein
MYIVVLFSTDFWQKLQCTLDYFKPRQLMVLCKYVFVPVSWSFTDTYSDLLPNAVNISLVHLSFNSYLVHSTWSDFPITRQFLL